jgi:plastocyanin
MRKAALVFALVGAIVLAGTWPSGAGEVRRVRMVDDPRNRFRPVTVEVSVGTKVRWVNVGEDRHSTKSRDNLWESELLDPGERFTRRFRRRGTFRYFCTIHPEMVGTVVVT